MLLRWSIHFPPPPFSVREIWALQIVVFMCFSVFHVHVHVLAHSGYGIFVIVIMDTEWFTHSLQPPLSQFWDEWLRGQFVSKLNDPEEYWTYKLSLLWCTDQQSSSTENYAMLSFALENRPFRRRRYMRAPIRKGNCVWWLRWSWNKK